MTQGRRSEKRQQRKKVTSRKQTLAIGLPNTKKQQITIDGRDVPLSNLDKVLFPDGQVRKADVIDFYVRMAGAMLPHLRDRPVTLKRYPNGALGDFFYEKDAPGFTPDWVETFPVPRRESGGMIRYILVNNRATLVWLANLANLEIHPFLHRVPRIDRPTSIVFDLDPGEGTDVLACARVAFLLKELFERLELQSFPKVSGSKGLQLYVPLNTPVTYDVTGAFAQALAQYLESQAPKLVISDMAKAKRKGKVFIDWSQNAPHKTTVGVYSLRAKRDRPYVSMPLSWDELRDAVKRSNSDSLYFEAGAALERLAEKGDLFEPVLKVKQRIPTDLVNAIIHGRKPGPKTLRTYRKKLDFLKTTEPSDGRVTRSAQGSRRRFVVQKHAASQLHYDFRLEMHDVLKSWAVPRGVPYKPGERRSAFVTEDHPIEYLDFEGTIPDGQYGGGTVMVWDIGTYEVVEGNYYKGSLHLSLKGT